MSFEIIEEAKETIEIIEDTNIYTPESKLNYEIPSSLVELFDSSKILMLIKIDNGKILAKGNLNRIKSYINLRKIDHKKIYKWIDV